MGTWDNFKYQENLYRERIDDNVKFWSITMALWIKKDWKKSTDDLKQLIWNIKSDVLGSKALTKALFVSKQRD